jgi:D-xylose transport system ATP-binding protein
VGAKFAIYQLISELARKGTGIILISSDLTEVVGLAHRVLVMDKGEIKASLDNSQADLNTIMDLLLGN